MSKLPGNPDYPPGFSPAKHAKRFGPPPKREMMPCPDCDGEGTIPNEENDDEQHWFDEKCTRCRGTGEVEADR